MDVSTNDARLHVEVSGHGEPPIVLLHGLGGSSGSWPVLGDGFAQHRRTLCPDLRGCGSSAVGAAPYTLERLAADIVAILDALEVDRCHLVGHSLGGVVAQQLLTCHGDRCAASVLVSTSSRVGDKAAESWRRLADVVESRGLNDSPAARARAFSARFAAENPGVVEALGALTAATDPAVYAAQARLASHYDFTEALAAVPQPILVVQGLADRLTSPGGSVLLSRALPNARLEMIEGAGHNVHLEMGGAFVRLVEDFLADGYSKAS